METQLSRTMDLISNANQEFDLTNPFHQKSLISLSEHLLQLNKITIDNHKELIRRLNTPLEYQLAVKLLESRRCIENIAQPLNIAVVFAMWGEHNRLLPKTEQNQNGEDSLIAKISQLEWITRGTKVNWHLYAVDDGCPHQSGAIAQQQLERCTQATREKVTVLHLEDALPAESGPLVNLKSANDSRKGGAIVYGCHQALAQKVDAVIYTDADNSVHLGQVGLLLEKFVEQGSHVVLGNRKHPDSILVKQEERWGIGIKTLRHMQRMIGSEIFEKGIKDTQAAFKLYSADALEVILAKPTVYDFSFDTDWIFAAMEKNLPIVTVPFAFIDSAAESASIVQGPMTTWYVLLDGLVQAARARGISHSEEMADVFKSEISSHEDLELIIDTLPPELASAKEQDLGNPAVMSPQSVRMWLHSAKSMKAQAAM
ncbi:glycosyltransferase [Vibrio maerlii]|uniref:glycosyltransferase n=1 Tax=Vibrio maerlii TaxID=2231648 RepID=UPI000E3BCC77|nr:glycosyltransferase [Vibrio maerlii]